MAGREFVEKVCANFRGIPLYRALPISLMRPLFTNLRLASLHCSAYEYASFCTFSSIIFFLLSLLVFSSGEIIAALAISIFTSIFLFLLLLKYPAFLAAERTREIERDAATGLKAIHLCLSGGNSFESSLQAASTGHGEFSKEISKTVREMRSGTPASNAIKGLAEFDSLLLKRAASQIAFEYEHGGKGEGLSAIADEALARQQVLAKEHSGKLAFLTVVFVAVSAVVPALFSAYVIIAGSFLQIPFSKEQVLLVFVLVFPLADALVLAYTHISAPKLSVGR